jgi:hypothetical protein
MKIPKRAIVTCKCLSGVDKFFAPAASIPSGICARVRIIYSVNWSCAYIKDGSTA